MSEPVTYTPAFRTVNDGTRNEVLFDLRLKVKLAEMDGKALLIPADCLGILLDLLRLEISEKYPDAYQGKSAT